MFPIIDFLFALDEVEGAIEGGGLRESVEEEKLGLPINEEGPPSAWLE